MDRRSENLRRSRSSRYRSRSRSRSRSSDSWGSACSTTSEKIVYSDTNKKTRICFRWKEKKCHLMAIDCPFAHGPKDLSDSVKYKRTYCHYFLEGVCKFGATCNFAHSSEDLRVGERQGSDLPFRREKKGSDQGSKYIPPHKRPKSIEQDSKTPLISGNEEKDHRSQKKSEKSKNLKERKQQIPTLLPIDDNNPTSDENKLMEWLSTKIPADEMSENHKRKAAKEFLASSSYSELVNLNVSAWSIKIDALDECSREIVKILKQYLLKECEEPEEKKIAKWVQSLDSSFSTDDVEKLCNCFNTAGCTKLSDFKSITPAWVNDKEKYFEELPNRLFKKLITGLTNNNHNHNNNNHQKKSQQSPDSFGEKHRKELETRKQEYNKKATIQELNEKLWANK